MRISGWIFLGMSWASIICLAIFCFYKIFTRKRVD